MRNFTTMFRGTDNFSCSMCVSTRNDNLWGGTGSDTEYGYAGDDAVFGERLILAFIARNNNVRKKMA
jgi:hypothetical protein